MRCPTCDKEASFTDHCETVRGSLGLSYDEDWGMDYHDESWLTCDECGAPTDDQELRRCNPDEVIL